MPLSGLKIVDLVPPPAGVYKTFHSQKQASFERGSSGWESRLGPKMAAHTPHLSIPRPSRDSNCQMRSHRRPVAESGRSGLDLLARLVFDGKTSVANRLKRSAAGKHDADDVWAISFRSEGRDCGQIAWRSGHSDTLFPPCKWPRFHSSSCGEN